VTPSLEIRELDFALYRLPPATPWQDATHKVTSLEFIVTRLQTANGTTGTGVSYTVGVGGSAILALLDDYCKDIVIGRRISEPERIWKLLFDHLHRTGSGGINTLAVAAVDTAVWDALARSHRIPLWRALGGARQHVRGYGSGIDLFMSTDELVTHVRGYLQQGYQAIKIKVGRPQMREDLERVEAVRNLIGPDRQLLLDANQCWTIEEAVRRAHALERYEPTWLEEPLTPEDVSGHARLRMATSIPIAVGESLYTAPQFLEYLRAGAVDVIQPDIARVGGYTPWKKIAALAEAWNVSVAPHFLAELSLHALCAVPNGLILENVTGGSFYELGLTDRPLEMREGEFVASDVYGHGLNLDPKVIERWQVRRAGLSALETSNHR
jgi:L-alanine-DL-glutamate epimerase-like enolase superfamily enzyme